MTTVTWRPRCWVFHQSKSDAHGQVRSDQQCEEVDIIGHDGDGDRKPVHGEPHRKVEKRERAAATPTAQAAVAPVAAIAPT